MPEIKLEHVTKRWAKFYAVEDLNLTIENNAFVTLLGPSGCGKTTTLRMIAGLETPTSGRITIGDKVVFDSDLGINVPANKRKVGFLFQNYALWPNMTVYQNISFGLSNVKEALPKIDFDAKNAARLAEILKTPADVVSVLDECRDKDGKLEEKKAILKLIDAFTLSQYTAKKLFDYHLEAKTDCASEIAALTAKVETAKKAAQDAGFTLDDEFRYTKDGEIVTQVRKLTKEEIDLSVRRVSRIVTCNADTQRQFFNQYVAEKVLQCRYCKLCNFFYQVQKPLNTVFFYKARLFFCRFFRLFGFLSLFFCFFLLLFLFGFCRHKLKLYKSDIHGAPKLLFI